jgi:hypothetical protein
MSKEVNQIKQVCEAIANVQDHGADCGCSQCQGDKETISKNPEVASAVASLTTKNK